jgi:hypothetical protein
MQNYAKAAADFRKVLQLKPNDADAKSRLKYAEQELQWQLKTPTPAKTTRRTTPKTQIQKSATPTQPPAR